MAINLSRETKVYLSTVNGVHATSAGTNKGGIQTISVHSGGTSGYEVGDLLVQNSASDSTGSGVGARVYVAAVSSGVVTKVVAFNNGRGRGHAAADRITFPTAQVVKGTGNSATVSGTVQLDVDAVGADNATVDGARTGLGLFRGNSTNANTFRIGVLDGYSFSQANTSTDVTLTEAGTSPVRGSKRFNDALDAGEWSFQTYVRPFVHGANSYGTENNHGAVEDILWSAMAGTALTSTGSAATPSSSNWSVDFEESDKHELLKFQIYFVLENTTYRLNECQVNQAEIDFSIDGIGTITWSGNCTTIDQISVPMEDPNVAFHSDSSESARAYSANATEDDVESFDYVNVSGVDDADYLKNKLSTLTLSAAAQGGGASAGGLDSRTYSIAITGGSISIANNITYLTPETLGLVDKSIGSFTGTRQVTGSLTCYLDTKTNGSNQLLKDLQGATSLVNNAFDMNLFMGGGSSATPRVDFQLDKAHVSIPTIDVADVISTTIEFTAQGTTISDQDELKVVYVGSTSHSDSKYATDRTV